MRGLVLTVVALAALTGCAKPHFVKLDSLGRPEHATAAGNEQFQRDWSACSVISGNHVGSRNFAACMRAKGYVQQ